MVYAIRQYRGWSSVAFLFEPDWENELRTENRMDYRKVLMLGNAEGRKGRRSRTLHANFPKKEAIAQ
jgi:hypothetical protein